MQGLQQYCKPQLCATQSSGEAGLLRHLIMAAISCQQQGRLPFWPGLIYICAGCQQQADDICMPVPCGYMHSCFAQRICQRHSRPMLQEKLHAVGMATC